MANLFRNFDFYDIIVNVIPGAVLIVGFYPWIKSIGDGIPSLVLFTVLVILSYLVGQAIQGISSVVENLIGREDHFRKIMESVWEGDSDNELQKNFWERAKERFQLSEEFSNSKSLLKLILSYLWDKESSRAMKLQSIYTFHRSMWAVSIILAIFSVAYTLVEWGFYGTGYFFYLYLVLISIFGILIFYYRKKKFSKEFIDYCIYDFYQIETE